jgi:hypothetical protein
MIIAISKTGPFLVNLIQSVSLWYRKVTIGVLECRLLRVFHSFQQVGKSGRHKMESLGLTLNTLLCLRHGCLFVIMCA